MGSLVGPQGFQGEIYPSWTVDSQICKQEQLHNMTKCIFRHPLRPPPIVTRPETEGVSKFRLTVKHPVEQILSGPISGTTIASPGRFASFSHSLAGRQGQGLKPELQEPKFLPQFGRNCPRADLVHARVNEMEWASLMKWHHWVRDSCEYLAWEFNLM